MSESKFLMNCSMPTGLSFLGFGGFAQIISRRTIRCCFWMVLPWLLPLWKYRRHEIKSSQVLVNTCTLGHKYVCCGVFTASPNQQELLKKTWALWRLYRNYSLWRWTRCQVGDHILEEWQNFGRVGYFSFVKHKMRPWWAKFNLDAGIQRGTNFSRTWGKDQESQIITCSGLVGGHVLVNSVISVNSRNESHTLAKDYCWPQNWHSDFLKHTVHALWCMRLSLCLPKTNMTGLGIVMYRSANNTS